MLIHIPIRIRLAAIAVALALGAALPRTAEAAFEATMQEVGDDITVTGSGTINFLGLLQVTPISVGSLPGELMPDRGSLSFGVDGPAQIKRFGFVTEPAGAFGTSTEAPTASARNGDFVAISSLYIFLDASHGVEDVLNASMTFAGRSYAELGITPGTYVWRWGEGDLADSFTLNILAPSPVPEPQSFALLGLGLAVLLAARRRC